VSGVTALIDGDIIVYSIGFFNDIVYYTVLGKEQFTYKKDATKYCKDNGIAPKLIVKHHEANDIKKSLDGIDWMIKEISKATECDAVEVFLTGKDNFRVAVATTAPYKGNRKDTPKPFHFKEMREYLVKGWEAQVVDGMEADDALGIAQTKAEPESTIICSIDKDLLMVRGLHYNWTKKAFTKVDQFTGLKSFYTQLLTGDRTDNIIGLKGVGDVRAGKILAGAKTEMWMYEQVCQAYKAEFGVPKYMDRLKENAALLYIRQFDAMEWTPPDERV